MALTEKVLTTLPEFGNEELEAQWWDDHKGQVEERLVAAMRDRTAQSGTAQRLAGEARSSQNITIRMPLAGLERARR